MIDKNKELKFLLFTVNMNKPRTFIEVFNVKIWQLICVLKSVIGSEFYKWFDKVLVMMKLLIK
jgi:hypothetical protein